MQVRKRGREKCNVAALFGSMRRARVQVASVDLWPQPRQLVHLLQSEHWHAICARTQRRAASLPMSPEKRKRPTSAEGNGAHHAAEHIEQLLDEALAETFPASDPISIAVDTSTGPVGNRVLAEPGPSVSRADGYSDSDMPETLSKSLRELVPTIIQRWDDRVRAEVAASAEQEEIILRDHVDQMLEVVAKILSAETDPKTAARDLAYITIHAEERANQSVYSLEEMVLECQILQEVVVECLGSRQALSDRECTIVSSYFNELVRIAAGEFARIQAAQLAASSRSKDEFLAMLAHELRNPLAAISSSLMVLRASNRSEQMGHAIDIADRQVGHMTQMVDDLLDVARITEGKMVLHLASLDLGVVVHHAVEAARGLFEKHQHTLTMSQAPERICLEGDPTRLDQCLTNILANAAKYTPRGGEIEVIVSREDNEAVVRVKDNGIGIAPHLLPDVFELFRQATRSLDRPEGGLGIGLTVVRRLVEMHGGRVEAKSEGLGKGSEFALRLPIGECESKEANAQSQTTTTPVGVRVLLVEDNEDSADMLDRLLQALGHNVAVASDGPSALEAITWHRPDLALVDIGLPGMTGYELAVKLRASDHCPSSMRLVACTGYEANAEALQAAGFDAHVTKPLELEELKRTFANVVQTEPIVADRANCGLAELSKSRRRHDA